MKTVQLTDRGMRKYFSLLAAGLFLGVGFFLAACFLPQPAAEEPVTTEAVATQSSADYETEFFSDYRQKRLSWRGEEDEYFRTLLADQTLAAERRSELTAAYSAFIAQKQAEDQVEEILRGRGYADALLILGDELSFLIVSKRELTEDERAALASFVCAYTAIAPEQLSVYSVY